MRRRDEARTAAATAALARLRQLGDGEDRAAPVSDAVFFRTLGFDEVLSVDVSAFEHADYIHDLNTPGLAARLPGPVNLAVETGTAEHVFHIPQYLQNVGQSLAVGGVVLHVVPAHGFMDHGFYQFSPTLFHDFYAANRFDILDLLLLETATDDWSSWQVRRYQPGEFDRADRTRFRDRYVVAAVAARKRADSTTDAIPQQRIYRANDSWRLESTEQVIAATQDLGPLSGPFIQEQGYCWRIPLARNAGAGDTVLLAMRSQLVLCEDGRPLGPAHAPHTAIRELGGGAYSHWEYELLFSTSDHSDPNSNGRCYRLRARTGSEIAGILDTTLGAENSDGPSAAAMSSCSEMGVLARLRAWLWTTMR
jgi:hypothetical protein